MTSSKNPGEKRPLQLRLLSRADERSFMEAVEAFRKSEPDWEFALGYELGMRFDDYVTRLENWARGERLPERFVRGSFYVGLVDGEVVGRVSIRSELNEFLEKYGGHVGYGVIPSARGRGYATEMLRQALVICSRDFSLRRVLVTCDDDNLASRKVIERCGGVLEGQIEEPATQKIKLRFWISTET